MSARRTTVPRLVLRHSSGASKTRDRCDRRTVLKKNGLSSRVGEMSVGDDLQTEAGSGDSIKRVKVLSGRARAV